MPHRMELLIAAITVLCLLGRAAAVGPRGIVIDTDRSVNCATVETIVADVTAGCKNDQEKAVALYDFVVRTVWMPYVYGQPKERIGGRLSSVRDPLKVLNVYGAAGCDIQADVFCTLLHAAGITPRRLDPGFAHGSNEVKWGGKWHWMDVWLPCYLTDEKGEIYSYEELMADRSLIDKAVAAGRVSANFMFNPGPDVKAVKNAKNHRPAPDGSGVKKCRYVEDLRLRPGESVTWLWDHVGKWYWPEEKYSCPAFKFAKDANCKQAFAYWEPYKKTIPNGPHPWNNTYYRYYGNAILTTDPPLTKRGLADVGAKLSNAAFAGGGVRQAGKAPGLVEVAFGLPYIIADTEIEAAAEGEGAVKFTYSVDAGKTFLPGKEIPADGKPARFGTGKPNSREYPEGTTSGQYRFVLRAELVGGATLTQLKVTNTAMLNFYSRPWLEVGKNQVTVTCKNGDALGEAPLEITWRWLEDWKDEKSFTHTVRKSGEKAVVLTGGTKRPKMKSVTITCPAGTRSGR